MLKVILNRLKPQGEETITKEQAGFRELEGAPQNRSLTLESCVKSTSNTSRICTMSSLILKKALDRVWQAALRATMRKYNISANLVRTIDKATSAVRMNGSIGEWFRTTVGIRQGCLL